MSESLDILYQDEWFVAVDKPAGHLVHPAENPQPDDLVAMKIIRDQIGTRVHPIHRLDRPTCGVLFFGKEVDTARKMHQAFESHEVTKIYWAVVDGCPARAEWVCEEPIQKAEGKPFRTASTDFKVLATSAEHGVSLIQAEPHTGRYHQIRRHLLHAGLPIVGDYRYAGIERSDYFSDKYNLDTRMLLQAKSLSFKHPVTEERIVIKSPELEKFTQFF